MLRAKNSGQGVKQRRAGERRREDGVGDGAGDEEDDLVHRAFVAK